MARTLAVWLYGVHVAHLGERRTGRLALEYTDEALGAWPIGTPLLSVALPTRPDRRHAPARVTPYFEGLLPEGMARNVIEDEFEVRRGDVFGLLAAIGRDCAGAVVIQPDDDEPPGDRHKLSGDVLGPDDLRTAFDALGSRPLGAGQEVRVSLAGQQDKLLLARDDDGRWLRPTRNTPSTHILKPEDARFPGSANNEALCLTLARVSGLADTAVEVVEVGRPVLIVSRYDRVRHDDGSVSRVHQEDMCQAMSVPVDFRGDAKYESAGGPAYRDVARIVDNYAADQLAEFEKLIRIMTFTVVVGNADAHGKNLSLVHTNGAVALAPLYDVMCTAWYRDVVTPQGALPVSTALAMTVNGVLDLHEVTVADLVSEAVSWRIGEERVRAVVADFLERVAGAIDQAGREFGGDVDELATYIAARVAALRAGRPAGG